MAESYKDTTLENLRYFIDLDWFEENERSFVTVAFHCLCKECQKRFSQRPTNVEKDSLLTNIRDCCSKTPDFLTHNLPLLVKIFRVLLSRGNEPMSLEELSAQLAAYSATSAAPSPRMLKRLMDNDRYYGFRQKSRLR